MSGRFVSPVRPAVLRAGRGGREAAQQSPRPNIVLIVIDDFGWADLGCYGSTYHETPNLDALARRGMRFTDAYAACPVCSPSRAAIMTGKYPARLHLTDWLPGRPDRPSQKLLRPPIRQQLPLEEITLAEALEPAGYVSASIGKWHLGGPPFWPEHQGFDLNVGGTETGSPPGGYFRFKTPSLQARTDDRVPDRPPHRRGDRLHRAEPGPAVLPLPAPLRGAHPAPGQAEVLARYRTKPTAGSRQDNPIYAAMIQSLDEGVGRLLRKLDELGIADRTVVVFTSDNGGLSVKEGPNTPATSNARCGREGLSLRRRHPGADDRRLARGDPTGFRLRRCRSADRTSIPTVLEIAGVPPTAGQVVDGESLVPLLKRNRVAAARRPVLALSALQQPGRQAGRGHPRRKPQTDRML